jgi:hypothetical protein
MILPQGGSRIFFPNSRGYESLTLAKAAIISDGSGKTTMEANNQVHTTHCSC